MLCYLSNVWSKFSEILRYPLGWIAGIVMFLTDALTGGAIVVYLVVIASVIDLFCGMAVSHKRGEFTLSEMMRATVEKLVVYGAVILLFLSIDNAVAKSTSIEVAITSATVGVVIALAEGWSILAGLLILYPDNFLLSLLQKALTGEIARKLKIDEAEVAKALSNARRSKMAKRAKRGNDGRYVKSTKTQEP